MALAVFVGPSLPVSRRLVREGVTYLPPARRGDVAAASRCFETVLLIDGVFHHDLAPTSNEIYAATKRCRTFGAASMGALRAAESRQYGMTPLGIIARWYSEEKIDGEDEVAVIFDPATERALSVPSVNVRYMVRLAIRRKLMTCEEGATLIRQSRQIFYAERTWESVLALVPASRTDAIAMLVPLAELKLHDAAFALRRCLRSRA